MESEGKIWSNIKMKNLAIMFIPGLIIGATIYIFDGMPSDAMWCAGGYMLGMISGMLLMLPDGNR